MEHKTIASNSFSIQFGFQLRPFNIKTEQYILTQVVDVIRKTNVSNILIEIENINNVPQEFIKFFTDKELPVDIFLKNKFNQQENINNYCSFLDKVSDLGVKQVVLFDLPNMKEFWDPEFWIKPNLIKLFIDKLLMVHDQAKEKGINISFPPLYPGGDYWDTAFLRQSIQRIKEVNRIDVLKDLKVASYAWTFGHELNWGTGGPLNWPLSVPYDTPENSQDQIGFNTYQWYQAEIKAETNMSLPIILLETGNIDKNTKNSLEFYSQIFSDFHDHAKNIEGKPTLLSGDIHSIFFSIDYSNKVLLSKFLDLISPLTKNVSIESKPTKLKSNSQSIRHNHYLLIPDESWLVVDSKKKLLEPFIKQFDPLVGSSVKSARNAKEVTVVGSYELFPNEIFESLKLEKSLLVRKLQFNIPNLEEK